MVINKRFYSSGRLRRPWWRCLQNKNIHFSKCVSFRQRRMREDRKRNSEEEAGVFRRSRWISLKKTKPKVVVNSSNIITEAENEEEAHENIENEEPNEELPSFSGGTSSGSNNKTAGKFPQQTVVNVWQVSFENFRWSEGQVMSQENVSISVPALSVISDSFLTILFPRWIDLYNNIEISIGSNSLPHDLFSTLTSAFKDFLCSFAEKKQQMLASHFSNPQRRRVSCQRRIPLQKSARRWRHLFPIKKLLIGVFWPQRKLVKDEKKKGRRKGGRKTKSFCWNWRRYFENKNYAFSTISFALVPVTVSAGLAFGFIYTLSWKMFYEI